MSIEYTQEELDEFDELIDRVDSRIQSVRTAARFEMNRFVEKHGKEKCDAMFEKIKDKYQ